jgi:hypothetical protein
LISIIPAIFICLTAFGCLLWILRRDQQSLGLPIAYLSLLLLNHVPGAIAHAFSSGDIRPSVGELSVFFNSTATEIGIGLTAIGSVCFLVGVGLAHLFTPRVRTHIAAVRKQYWYFCLIVGWISTFGLSTLAQSLKLAIVLDNAGTIWMLGVMLGLRANVQQGDFIRTVMWLAALTIYPSVMLLLGGFLSYGTQAFIIVVSVLAISVRSNWRVVTSVIVISLLSFNLFLGYYSNRNAIRAEVWGGAPLERRIDVISRIVTDFEWFDPANQRHLQALDARLNQNNFVGMAAIRLDQGTIDYRYGETLLNGLIALIPRAFWPDKPMFGGSNDLVTEFAGLQLDKFTSWGVGNVMEFYVNFGLPGLICGFLGLGWLIGWLDRNAAVAEDRGHLGKVFLFFLPGVALIQPIGSVAEMLGAAGAALAGAFVWKWVWELWALQAATPTKIPRRAMRRGRDAF